MLSASVQAHGKGGFMNSWLWLALVQEQRGKHDQAVRHLTRFEAWHKTQTFTDWRLRVKGQALLDEARRVVHGPDTPKDASRKDNP